MPVRQLHTTDEFDQFSSGSVVLYFYADFVERCVTLHQVLIELSNLGDFSGLQFVEIDAEKLSPLSLKYKIKAVPTFIFLGNGLETGRLEGGDVQELRNNLARLATLGLHDMAGETIEKDDASDIHKTLDNLISQRPVMLIMKGSPEQPKCKFSRETVGILDNLLVDYGYFDILTNDKVREALKKHCNWPSYPQLYFNGQLLGGVDILKEMQSSGELQQLNLPKKKSLDTRLRDLINRSTVMLFMKGNPDQPKCGFSREIVKILHLHNITFDTFDILTDNEIRQGLKTFSNWPTYPQLYIKAELVGGLDIIREISESGELTSMIS